MALPDNKLGLTSSVVLNPHYDRILSTSNVSMTVVAMETVAQII